MSTYTATICWTRDPSTDFTKGQYSRAHSWEFDGGLTVPASPSPHVVSAPWNDPHGVDPEEAGSALIFVSLDPDVLAAARTEFEGRGVEVKDGWWGYKLMIVEDPDGNQLYFPYPKDGDQ